MSVVTGSSYPHEFELSLLSKYRCFSLPCWMSKQIKETYLARWREFFFPTKIFQIVRVIESKNIKATCLSTFKQMRTFLLGLNVNVTHQTISNFLNLKLITLKSAKIDPEATNSETTIEKSHDGRKRHFF